MSDFLSIARKAWADPDTSYEAVQTAALLSIAESLAAIAPDKRRPRTPIVTMKICERCGNKRCPHAWDLQFVCTGSNEPGQIPVDIIRNGEGS